MRARSAQKATARPVSPPNAERERLSIKSWPMMRGRVAPMAKRTAISLTRLEPRTSRRLARVGAGNQQDGAGGGHQDPKRSGELATGIRTALRTGQNVDPTF